MSATYSLDRSVGLLIDEHGRVFDAAPRQWRDAANTESRAGEALDGIAAATWLQKESGTPLRVPIGVIGPRDASAAQRAAAEHIGFGLATMGFCVVCGGRGGVMQATCEGVNRGGGIAIGLLP